ncbi:MAG: hypothetical protein AB1757_28835 [Acidobacteriota bacterium]
MRNRLSYIFALSLLISGIAGCGKYQPKPSDFLNRMMDEARTIPLNYLLDNRDSLNGQQVIVKGYARIGNGKYVIFPDAQEETSGRNEKGIWIDLPTTIEKFFKEYGNRLDKKHITVEATFKLNNKGKDGLWAGTLEDIKSITPID